MQKFIYSIIIAFFCVTTCYAKAEGFKEGGKKTYDQDILHTYTHEQSGLEVIWIENHDSIKSFMLGVKTPTTDSTGVNHIIEHTLFTGSKKYPSSSLFFDASSQYPHVYMNALTSGDMTMFPFSTPYMACYKALVDIYLDSIFHPGFLENPYGFYEEGFYCAPTENRVGGVVYHEMKGARGNAYRSIYRNIRKSIYEGSVYAFDSGGDPNEIPTLTYDQFINTYKSYYYPANMKVILYGDLPIKEILGMIEDYVEDEVKSKEGIRLEVDAISESKEEVREVLPYSDTACLVRSFVPMKKMSMEEELNLDLWLNTYLINPQSSFVEKLQYRGSGSVSFIKDDDLPYPIYSIIVKDIPLDQLELYKNTVNEALQETLTLRGGADQLLEAHTLSKAKWQIRASNESKERGINISESLLSSWAHEKDAHMYYEEKACLLKTDGIRREEAAELLAGAKEYQLLFLPGEDEIKDPITLTTVDEERWEEICQEMTKWQAQKITLTPIDLKELIQKPTLQLTVKNSKDKTFYTTKAKTDFARSQVYFPTSHVEQKDLPYLFLYSHLLEESAKEKIPFKGDVDLSCIAFEEGMGYMPYLKLSITTPEEEREHGSIWLEARRSLLEKKEEWYSIKLKELVNGQKNNFQNNILGSLRMIGLGAETGMKRYFYEQGYPFYIFCKGLMSQKETGWIKEVQRMDALVYHQAGIIEATTMPKVKGNPYEKSLESLLQSLPKGSLQNVNYTFKIYDQESMLAHEGAVDYLYLQYTTEENLDGTDYVTASYVTRQYLSPQIRVRLGAYGAGCNAGYPHTLSLFTYRDPSYKQSLEVFRRVDDFLLEAPISEHILKASKAEALMNVQTEFNLLGSPLEVADALEKEKIMGITTEKIVKIQKEILEASEKDIKSKYTLFRKIIDKGALSIATKNHQKKSSSSKIYQFK